MRHMSTTASGSVDEDLKKVFREADDPVLSAVEVAEELDVTQQAAHKRLSNAHDYGNIKRKTVGARAVVWWLPGHDEDSSR